MTDFTLTIAAHVSQQDPLRCWIAFSTNQAKSYRSSRLQLRTAFLHTINALHVFNSSSVYFTGSRDAFEALSVLDRQFEVFHNYTVYAPGYRQKEDPASTESISTLLRRRHPKKDVQDHIRVLVAAGRDIRRMQSLILEAQKLLATLQISARSLRDVGANAQGSEDPVEMEMTARSLEIGCASILSDLAEF